MIIYNSMIVWIVMLSFFHKYTLKTYLRVGNEHTGVSWLLAILTFSYIVFWVGIRSGFVDTRAYIMMFKSTPTSLQSISSVFNSNEKAPGFELACILFKTFISQNYHAWFMLIAIIQGYSIMYTLKRKSINFFYSSFLFIASLNFSWMLNGIRQFIPAAVLFFLTDWIEKRNTKKYIIAVLLLSTIHFTALIMIPIYFFVTGRPFGKKMMLFIALLLLAVLFLNPFLSFMESSLEQTAYSGYTEQFASDDGVHPLRVAIALTPVIIAFVNRDKLDFEYDQNLCICVNMSVIAAGLYFLGVFTSGIMIGRFPIFFELYNLILLPYLCKTCFRKRISMIMFFLCTVGYLAFYYLMSRGFYYVSELTGVLQ